MTVNLDVETLSTCYGIACCIQCIALTLQHKTNKSEDGPGWWAIGSAFSVLGFFANFFRHISDLYSFIVIFYNMTFVINISCIYIGITRLNKARFSSKSISAIYIITIAVLSCYTFGSDSIPMRRAITSITCAVFSLASARAVTNGTKGHTSPIALFTQITFLFNAFWLLALSITPLLAGQLLPGLEPPSPLIISYLLVMTTSTLWTFCLATLVSQKLSERLTTSKQFLESTLDALSTHIAIIQESGEIILVNKAWRNFATANGIDPRTVSEGTNYVTICDSSASECSHDASSFSDGIKTVLNGNADTFTMEYACHSPNTQRWFVGRVTRFPGQGPKRAVIAHEDITERKTSEIALAKLNKQLESMSNEDALTKISNRRHLDRMLSYECSRHARSGSSLALIMLDIDYFKNYNDTYGHVTGDECLQRVAAAISESLRRPTDIAARYGGEEFICLLPDTSLIGAVSLAETIRRAVADLAIPHATSQVANMVTVSIGALALTCTPETAPDHIVKSVDALLYQAKNEGRNRVKFGAINDQLYLEQAHHNTGALRIVWDKDFASGNITLDQQHMNLMDMANDLLKHIFDDNSTPAVQSCIKKIMHHAAQHFKDEEDILRTVGYPELDDHIAEHARLLHHCEALTDSDNNDVQKADILQIIIHDLVMKHMLSEDVKYHLHFKVCSNT